LISDSESRQGARNYCRVEVEPINPRDIEPVAVPQEMEFASQLGGGADKIVGEKWLKT